MVDPTITDGGKVVLRKRRCNANRFACLWENREGTATYARLISTARRTSVQYLDIPSEHYGGLIMPPNPAAKSRNVKEKEANLREASPDFRPPLDGEEAA